MPEKQTNEKQKKENFFILSLQFPTHFNFLQFHGNKFFNNSKNTEQQRRKCYVQLLMESWKAKSEHFFGCLCFLGHVYKFDRRKID